MKSVLGFFAAALKFVVSVLLALFQENSNFVTATSAFARFTSHPLFPKAILNSAALRPDAIALIFFLFSSFFFFFFWKGGQIYSSLSTINAFQD